MAVDRECGVCKQVECKCDPSTKPPSSIPPATSKDEKPLTSVVKVDSPMDTSSDDKSDHCECSECGPKICGARKGCQARQRADDYRCCCCTAAGYGFPIRPVRLPATARASLEFLAKKKQRDDLAMNSMLAAITSLKEQTKDSATKLEFPKMAEAHELSASSASSEEDSEDDEVAKLHCMCSRCYNAMCKLGTIPNEEIEGDELRCCDCVRKLSRSPRKLDPWEMKMRVHFHKMAKKAREGKFHIVSMYDCMGLKEMDDAVAVSLLQKSCIECEELWKAGKRVYVPEELKLGQPPSDDENPEPPPEEKFIIVRLED